jgi:hypothetical protein
METLELLKGGAVVRPVKKNSEEVIKKNQASAGT